MRRIEEEYKPRSYRKILRISYKDRVTNKEVRAKILQAIGPHEDLTIVKRRKLQWYGHVCRSSGLTKTEEEVGRQHQGMDRLGVRQALESSREQITNGENCL